MVHLSTENTVTTTTTTNLDVVELMKEQSGYNSLQDDTARCNLIELFDELDLDLSSSDIKKIQDVGSYINTGAWIVDKTILQEAN